MAHLQYGLIVTKNHLIKQEALNMSLFYTAKMDKTADRKDRAVQISYSTLKPNISDGPVKLVSSKDLIDRSIALYGIKKNDMQE